MKIYTRVVLDWDGNILEEESYDYEGPVAQAGGGGGGDTTTVQKADPWGPQQQYLKDIFQQAQTLQQTTEPTFFPGQTIAEFNPTEQMAQRMALDAALGGQTNLSGAATGANQFLLGDVLTPGSNPYLASYAEGAVRPVFDQLARRTLPQITARAVGSGNLGGSRQGIAEGLAISDATQQAMDTTSRIYSDAYGQNLDALTKGLALTPQTLAGALAPAQTVGGVGEQQRAMAQALLDEQIARHEFEQTAPWNELAAYQGLVQGTFGGTGTSTVGGGETSTAQNLVGAAGTGLATYTALAPIAGPAAPFIAGGMALLSLF